MFFVVVLASFHEILHVVCLYEQLWSLEWHGKVLYVKLDLQIYIEGFPCEFETFSLFS